MILILLLGQLTKWRAHPPPNNIRFELNRRCMLQIDHWERWFSCTLDMLKIGRVTHTVTDGVYVFQIGPTSSEWLIYTPEPVPRIRVNRLELDVWSWKRGNWTTPHAFAWTKDTRMCNPKEIMRTHAHSQLVIMRTHALQGAMLPMELRKWLEGQIRLTIQLLSAEGSGSRWLLIDRCLISNPFLSTPYIQRLQYNYEQINSIISKKLSVASIYFLFGLGSMALPDFLHHIRLASCSMPRFTSSPSQGSTGRLDLVVCLSSIRCTYVWLLGLVSTWWASLLASSNQPLIPAPAL